MPAGASGGKIAKEKYKSCVVSGWLRGARVEPSPSLDAAIQLLRETNLPSLDLTEPMLEHFFYVGYDAALIGLIGLEMYSPDALLRSLVVAAAWRERPGVDAPCARGIARSH